MGWDYYFFRLFKIGGTKPTRFPGNFVFIPPRPRPRGRALRPRYKGSGRRRHRDRDRTGPWPKVRARRQRGTPARSREPRSGAQKAAAVPSPAAACGTERRCATHGAPRGAAGPGSCAARRPGWRRRSCCRAAAPDGSFPPKGFWEPRAGRGQPAPVPEPPGAALSCGRTAVTPPSERWRPGESCCQTVQGSTLCFVLKPAGWPGKGAAAALHACLRCPECSFFFGTSSVRFLLTQRAVAARSSAPAHRGGGDQDEALPALCPHCRAPCGPSALHPHAVLQQTAPR